MTRDEKLKDIKENPEQHKHDYNGLLSCCMIDGALDFSLMDSHPALGYNGGIKCDVTSGPCFCGATH